MTDLCLRPYLRMKGVIANQGVRSSCGPGIISLRTLLSSYSMPIYEKWQSLGGKQGRLGNSIGDQQKFDVDNHKFWGQKFEHGTIIDFGTGTVSSALSGDGAGGGAALPETPYMLTLESIQCKNTTKGEFEGDELWIRLILSTKATLNEYNEVREVNRIRNYRNNFRPGHNIHVGLLLYAGSLPEIFTLSYMAIEVDLDADAEQVLNTFTKKIKEKEGIWFTTGNSTFESILSFNIIMNALGTGSCMIDPNPWVHWIGGVAGTAMEFGLSSILVWYKSELIAAHQISFLGENLLKESHGELPARTEEKPTELTLYGSSASEKITILMRVDYSLYENGDICENADTPV